MLYLLTHPEMSQFVFSKFSIHSVRCHFINYFCENIPVKIHLSGRVNREKYLYETNKN